MASFKDFCEAFEKKEISVAWEILDEIFTDEFSFDGFNITPDKKSKDFKNFVKNLRLICIFASINEEKDFSYSSEQWSYSFVYMEYLHYFHVNVEHSCSRKFYNGLGDLLKTELKISDINIGLRNFTPLIFAILKNKFTAMTSLLDADVNPNQKVWCHFIAPLHRHTREISPLELAVLSGSIDFIKELIKRGAEITADSLEFALLNQQYEILELLLTRQDYPKEKLFNLILENRLDKNSIYALWKSGQFSKQEIVHFLKNSHYSKWSDIKTHFIKAIVENNIADMTYWLLMISEPDPHQYNDCLALERRNNDLSDLMDKKIISSLQFEYLSMLNTIFNVIISILPCIYYSLTKGCQQIKPHDLRFFSFGEKQKLENIIYSESHHNMNGH